MRRAATVLAAALAVLAAGCVLIVRGFTFEAVQLAAFAVVLVAVARIDAETRRIPNAFLLVACGIRFAYLALAACFGWADAAALLVSSLAGALVIGGALLAFAAIAFHMSPGEGIGGGDVKLFAVVGLYFGVEGGAAVVLAACVLGVVAGLVEARREGSPQGALHQTFAFAPSIAVAAIVAMLLLP